MESKNRLPHVDKRLIFVDCVGLIHDRQSDMLKRCKIVAVDQGDEPEEFLNVFGLESMEVKEEDKLKDKRYVRNIEKEEKKIAAIKSTRLERDEETKLSEIKNLLNEGEKITWLKSDTINLTDNWLKVLLKDKKYRGRLKSTKEAKEIEIGPAEGFSRGADDSDGTFLGLN